MVKDFYERKISSEEASEGYILVEKSALGVFPPVGTPFDLTESTGRTKAKIEARDCECRGPEKPHQHYFIRKPGLEKGSRWCFRRQGESFTFEPSG